MGTTFILEYPVGMSRSYTLMTKGHQIVCIENPYPGGGVSVTSISAAEFWNAEEEIAKIPASELDACIQDAWNAVKKRDAIALDMMGFYPRIDEDFRELTPADIVRIAATHIKNQAFHKEAEKFSDAMVELEKGNYMVCIKLLRHMQNIDVRSLRMAKSVTDRISLAIMNRATNIVKSLTSLVKGEISEPGIYPRPGHKEFMDALQELIAAEKANS